MGCLAPCGILIFLQNCIKLIRHSPWQMKTQISSKHAKMNLRVESLGLFGLCKKKVGIHSLRMINQDDSFSVFRKTGVYYQGFFGGRRKKRLEIRFSLGFFMKNILKKQSNL